MSKDGYELMGQKIQGYTIIKPIGQGKFSIVYRAQNDQGIPYALKKIKIFDMGDQKQRQKCLKQVDLMKPLDHPNIIKYIDSFIHNNELIIVTEWAEKGDLKKLIKEHQSDELPFQQSAIWEYMRQIASALKHMHQKRIMHRDLKPANIFISADSTLKVGDLGLGRIFGSQTLEAYSKVGTPLYMSPQLIKDTGYNLNADVWSLGCICYQLAELNSPFRNKQQKMSLMDLFQNITKCNYKPISSKYSPQLSRVIKDMIVVDPNKRLSSQQVNDIAISNIQNVKKSRLDPYIAMEDIHIKLNLLDYTVMFCKAAQRQPIHRFYFAIQDLKCPEHDQLYYFLQLSYWIMGLAKPDKKKEKLPIYTKTLIDWKSPDNACRKLFVDLNGIGVKFQDIEIQTVRNGYGESVCFLLNQVLNRELIRANFQFGQPQQIYINKQGKDYQEVQELKEDLDQIRKNSISQESLQEQSQFQQSIFFRKDKKGKIGGDNGKLLEKIHEFDDDDEKNMIIGKVQERQWRAQCLRLEKQLHQVTQSAKEARKKHGYQNFETSKICSSKLNDLVKFVKPATTILFRKIEEDLQIIQKGQKKINSTYADLGSKYKQKNINFIQISNRSNMLTTVLRDKVIQLQKTQEKIDQYSQKINTASIQSQNSRDKQLKSSIQQIKKQIKFMDQKKGILLWQLQRLKLRLAKKDFSINLLEDQQ